jgi:hypothetical protein
MGEWIVFLKKVQVCPRLNMSEWFRKGHIEIKIKVFGKFNRAGFSFILSLISLIFLRSYFLVSNNYCIVKIDYSTPSYCNIVFSDIIKNIYIFKL